MPERMMCDRAILASRSRLLITDQDLKLGQVEMFTIGSTVRPIKRPWGIEGGFAVVYKFRTKSGKLRALRCFRVPMQSDMQFRYEKIGEYFAKHVSTITAGFKYYPQGIVIEETIQGQSQKNAFPLIEMEWIEGVTLLEKLDELCHKGNRAALSEITNKWFQLLPLLQKTRIAHGDLSGSNIMVRPNGHLVLIDYDGAYIPSFTGRTSIVIGQEDYQHPDMQNRPFNEYMDDFSSLVISTTLLALQIQPTLWQKYTQHNSEGKLLSINMLFTKQDFAQPDQSPLFAELAQINDRRLSLILRHLKQACKMPITQVRFPWQLIDPEYESKAALSKLETAIQQGNDEEIVACWVPVLHHYPQAQRHLSRVEHARKIVAALSVFRSGLSTNRLRSVIQSYNTILDTCTTVKKEEQERLQLAQNFVRAYEDFLQANTNKFEQMLSEAWLKIQRSKHRQHLQIDTLEQQHVSLAQQRTAALNTFQSTLQHQGPKKNAQQIVNSYNPILDASESVRADERAILAASREFLLHQQNLLNALKHDDDRQIAHFYQIITGKPFQIDLTPEQQQRLDRVEKYSRLEDALIRHDYEQVLRTTREIEIATRSIMHDFRLILAKEKFIQQFDVSNVNAWMTGDRVTITWQWPANDLIEHAFILWRVDRWPRHPQTKELGTNQKLVLRSDGHQFGTEHFTIHRYTQLYIHVYLAIADFTQTPMRWFYSRGQEPTSQKFIRQWRP